MCKKFFECLCLLLMPFLLFSQEKNLNSYTQSIPGTAVTFDMIAIPAGNFKMGSPDHESGRSTDEGLLHEVKVDAFWMGKHEVLWDIFELYVYKDYDVTIKESQADAVTRPTKPYLDMTFGMGKENHPAIGMTQYNAIQFCKWLYSRTGIFYRLPTEAEWEYACRAGTKTAYSFGDDVSKLSDYAWYSVNSDEKTHPAGTKLPNPWGLFDMYGNVAEWTVDQYVPEFYSQFSGKIADNPVAKPTDLYPHTLRGGSFADEADKLRSASRTASDPEWKKIDPQFPKSNWWFPEAPFVGIRLVRPLNPPSKEEIESYYNKEPIADY